jgi:acyl dehydratase
METRRRRDSCSLGVVEWRPPAVGERASWTRTFTAEDIELYARITGDRNPLHFDDDFATGTRFGDKVVQGV